MSNALLSAQELSCPNCGAPGEMPAFGNAIQCEYCGTRFFLHTPDAQIALPATPNASPSARTLSPQESATIRKWVQWLIVLVVVTTVVPVLCSVIIGICGALGAFIPLFAR